MAPAEFSPALGASSPLREGTSDLDVEAEHRIVGRHLDEFENALLLMSTSCEGYPIVGASAGLRGLTGFDLEDLLGSHRSVLSQGVPDVAVSKSAKKTMESFCRSCHLPDLEGIADCATVQVHGRKGGAHFVSYLTLSRCVVQGRIYVLGLLLPIGEGLSKRLSPGEEAETRELARSVTRRVRAHLRAQGARSARAMSAGVDIVQGGTKQVILFDSSDRSEMSKVPRVANSDPPFAFSTVRLQDQTILLDRGNTAVRREPLELPTGCLVFGDRPLEWYPWGLHFSVRVNEVTKSFDILPLLGFTRRSPADDPDLFPRSAKCLGQSVLVGACGEAFARDQRESFKMSFKLPPVTEVQTWSLQPEVPPHKRAPPAKLLAGDVLGCTYTWNGHIQLWLNGEKVLDFDVERPVSREAAYYAVVDVSFKASSVTVLPPQADASRYAEPPIVEQKCTPSGGETAPEPSPGKVMFLCPRICKRKGDFLSGDSIGMTTILDDDSLLPLSRCSSTSFLEMGAAEDAPWAGRWQAKACRAVDVSPLLVGGCGVPMGGSNEGEMAELLREPAEKPRFSSASVATMSALGACALTALLLTRR